MEVRFLHREDEGYPKALPQFLGDSAPDRISLLGNAEILQQKALALFCSQQCPGSLILQTYDFACALRDGEVTTIGGFHSPMEEECLNLLLRGKQPVIVCPARSIEQMRLPSGWRKPLENGRLLILSPFEQKHRRITAESAALRNRFVAALADCVFIAYAAPGSKTEAFAQEIVSWEKRLLTLDSPANAGLVQLGAKGVKPQAPLEALPTPWVTR